MSDDSNTDTNTDPDAGMKRIVKSTVTDTLLAAMERADDMEDVLVIYYAKPGCKGSYLCTEGMKASETLWLVEQFKLFLLGVAKKPGQE